MAYPSTPTSLYINGSPEKAAKLTKCTDGTVAVSAVVNDPDSRDQVRMVVRYSRDKTFKTTSTVCSAFGRQGVRHRAIMTGLAQNTLYYVRVYTQQRDRRILSRSYNASSFWTARTAVPTGALASTTRERLYLNRFGTGFTQKALATLRAAGSPEAWLEVQLKPATVPESSKVAEVNSWFTSLKQSPAQKYAVNQAQTKNKGSYGRDLGNWSLLRRIYSERSVLETMTDFWTSHLHIPLNHDLAWVHRFDYDATIRTHALGKFDDLLRECSLHPAMRVYLDNWKSVRGATNENQGREVLELHTVGREAGYTEAMVKDSAKILSGYTVDWGTGKTFNAYYDANRHSTGAVRVLGFSHPNTAADGQAVTEAYLSYLAHHPSTARRIARKLAVQFVSDSPSESLIDHLAGVYSSSGTDISAVLTALSQHPEFLTSEGQKVRTPYADLVATARVLNIDVLAPSSSSSWANAVYNIHGAMQLFTWPRPDGPPLENAAWSTPSRMFGSYVMHRAMSGGSWPSQDVVYRTAASWLPAPSVTFDAYVDHLSRMWCGRPAGARQLKAALQAVSGSTSSTRMTPTTVLTTKHPLAGYLFFRLALALLDTPEHMTT
jgi:uncharacterized protein (DUF1800 family)